MGKAEAGTPKDISNRMKLKGLQKLKFFCQMCKKQCRDQNGFNCHLKSESHVSNMRQFAENPNDFISTYSKEFENNFMDLLKKKFNAKRVLANSVYKEFIGDKQHTHMNSTRWSTLSGFVNYLHETGKIEADQTDRGLFITYVDKGLEAAKQQREEERRIKLEKKTERMQKMELEKQMEYAAKLEETMNQNKINRNNLLPSLNLENAEDQDGALNFGISFNINNDNEDDDLKKRNNETQKNVFSLGQINNQKTQVQSSQKPLQQEKKELEAVDKLMKMIKGEKGEQSTKQQQKVQETMEEEESDEIPWIQESITVKIKDKELEKGEYYNEKAIVKEVNADDPFVGKIQLIKKPEFLETVIPKLEGEVMILKPGQYLKKMGILKSVIADKYEGVIQLKDNPSIQVNIPYELFSKV